MSGGLHRGGLYPEGLHLGVWQTPPEIRGILRDMVKKRAVRILLECFLVTFSILLTFCCFWKLLRNKVNVSEYTNTVFWHPLLNKVHSEHIFNQTTSKAFTQCYLKKLYQIKTIADRIICSNRYSFLTSCQYNWKDMEFTTTEHFDELVNK